MKMFIQIKMNPSGIYNEIKKLCEQQSDISKSAAMKAYMKNKFDFYGINAPLRKEMSKIFKKEYKLESSVDVWKLVDYLWMDPHREMQYFAIEFLMPYAKKMSETDLPFLETMITSKSWWDTVDTIVPLFVGRIFKNDSKVRNQYVYRWVESENVWLQRSAIIFQLKYGKETDWNLLSEAILRHDTSKEFFVRKGQGWALRQYSKYNPMAVQQFVEANPQLSGLTKKEALRNI